MAPHWSHSPNARHTVAPHRLADALHRKRPAQGQGLVQALRHRRQSNLLMGTSLGRDEHYVIDLCDYVLGVTAIRQFRFDFLTGDPGRNGRCRRLPVDAYYETLALAVEYRERQHSEAVRIMDRRHTVSGCTRGEQRRRYDERRRTVLPQHGIRLVELDYSMFAYDGQKRLRRIWTEDLLVVTAHLRAMVRGK